MRLKQSIYNLKADFFLSTSSLYSTEKLHIGCLTDTQELFGELKVWLNRCYLSEANTVEDREEEMPHFSFNNTSIAQLCIFVTNGHSKVCWMPNVKKKSSTTHGKLEHRRLWQSSPPAGIHTIKNTQTSYRTLIKIASVYSN